MQLLYSSPVPQQQFASLSLLLPPGSMAEPVVGVSPLCVVSKTKVLEAVSDLHHEIHKKTPMPPDATSIAADESQENKQSPKRNTFQVETFRSQSCSNLALQYLIVYGPESARLQTLVQSLHLPESVTPPPIDASAGVLGVVLCVGILGYDALYGMNAGVYSVPQRLLDCVATLMGRATTAGNPLPHSEALALLHAYLLTNPEERTNDRMAAETIHFPAALATRPGAALLSPMLRGPRGNRDPHDTTGALLEWNVQESETPTAQAARSLIDQLTVLSVADESASLAAYQRSGQERMAQLELGGRFRRRKDAADLDHHMEYKGSTGKQYTAAAAANRKAASSFPSKNSTASLSQAGSSAAAALRSSKKDTKVAARSPLEDRRGGRRASMGGAEPRQQRQQQMQVNFALNEDLSCSYKASQLVSCTVEGVVQVGTHCLFFVGETASLTETSSIASSGPNQK